MARRLALIVGVGDPPTTDGAPPEPPASVNDARAVRSLLSDRLPPWRFGLHGDDTTVLLDDAATKPALLDALADIAASCTARDQVVFYFSGHGWLDPEVGEMTLRDTALAPYGASSRADLIPDEVLYEWIQSVSERTTDLHVILDSCYAGGFEHADMPQTTGRRNKRSGVITSSGMGSPLDKGYALLASSRFSLQSATGWFTSLGAEHSAFTGSLIELIRSWSKDDDLPTYTELSVLLEARMRRLEFAQQPQVAGDTDRVLLGSAEWRRPSRRLARVRSPNQLEEGAAHGAVVGSRWVVLKVFAETEDPIRHLDDPVATVQVVKVHDFSSDFVVVEPPGLSQVDDDSLAIEVGRPPAGDGRLVVGIPDAGRRRTVQATRIGAIRDRLSSSPLVDVRVAPHEVEQVDVFLGRGRGRLDMLVGGVSARAYELGEFVETELCYDLEEMARGTWVHAASAHRRGAVKADTRVRLGLWRKPKGGFKFSSLARARRPAEYAPGDDLAVKVKNASEHELFFTLFHLGADRSVVRLHPTTGQNQLIKPGDSLSWGFGSTQRWTVGSSESHGAEPPSSTRQGVAVWATERETDLRNLCAAPVAHSRGPLDVSGYIVSPYWRGLDAVVPMKTAKSSADASAWFAVRRDYLVTSGR